MPDDFLIDAFVDAVREKRDADEFERLMLGKPVKGLDPTRVNLDLIDLMLHGLKDEPSALDDLKARRALERLQGRYPELWEQVVLETEAVDAR
jgi:hypothetical protein